ncbi:uncharacterized protein P884DRAFT_95641 [Thermothelomyces heterothallicus CBS 202.75]|uniref:uncharacterized protein n=1 Tax=Thermothelomyces heterothallicus CBS 202.75 TaxID=1149848 RepID=UPI003741F49D
MCLIYIVTGQPRSHEMEGLIPNRVRGWCCIAHGQIFGRCCWNSSASFSLFQHACPCVLSYTPVETRCIVHRLMVQGAFPK